MLADTLPIVQPDVTSLFSSNTPKPPSVALIVPLIVALDANRSPDKFTLNGAACSWSFELTLFVAFAPDQKTVSIVRLGLFIPDVLFATPSFVIEIYP